MLWFIFYSQMHNGNLINKYLPTPQASGTLPKVTHPDFENNMPSMGQVVGEFFENWVLRHQD